VPNFVLPNIHNNKKMDFDLDCIIVLIEKIFYYFS